MKSDKSCSVPCFNLAAQLESYFLWSVGFCLVFCFPLLAAWSSLRALENVVFCLGLHILTVMQRETNQHPAAVLVCSVSCGCVHLAHASQKTKKSNHK